MGDIEGVVGMNPFPVFGPAAQPSICLIPDWLMSNHPLRDFCVGECFCV